MRLVRLTIAAIALAAMCLLLQGPLQQTALAHGWQDPSDPFPDVHHPCIWDCARDRPRHRGHRNYDGGWRRDPHHIVVDCSGQRPDAAHSVQEAVDIVADNGAIVILPPGRGVTCFGSIHVTRPVTIRSGEGDGPAVLEAPENQPCLIADIHLGDALVMENVKFIARGHRAPCVQVRAGAVVLRNAHVDSRNTDWAFDVGDSGVLTIESSRVETDGSGVHARRAEVHLKDFEIDVEEGHNGVGLALDRTDGRVEHSTIVGGHIGILASSGVRGLSICDSEVRKTRNAMLLVPGQQGTLEVARVHLMDNIEGLAIAPSTDATISDMRIENSAGAAISVFGGAMRVTGNTVEHARVGIVVATAWDASPWHVPEDVADIFSHHDAADIVSHRPAVVQRNTIRGVGLGIDIDRKAGAIVTGNTITGYGKCINGDGWWGSRGDNVCNRR